MSGAALWLTVALSEALHEIDLDTEKTSCLPSGGYLMIGKMPDDEGMICHAPSNSTITNALNEVEKGFDLL